MARRRRYLEDNPETNQITEQSPAEVETAGPETINGTIVKAVLVNVRKEPQIGSEVLETLRKGDKVVILEKSGDFYKVSTSVNKLAYISKEYVKEE